MLKANESIEVEIQYTPELDEVGIYVSSSKGSPLSGQDILDAVAETLLLKYDYYDLEVRPDKDLDS